jgi:hypothetical protein
MQEPSLVILAAGMGSRYGGLKQIDTVGSNGESIIDFSIYDAIQAGFKKVYLIIRREHEEAFRIALTNRIERFIKVEFVFQELADIPGRYDIPKDRVKPWGTTHALLACRNQVKEPFAIINADDYYGKDAFNKIYAFLVNEVSDDHYGMIAYRLLNTLTDAGTVTRGVCDVVDGNLNMVVERQKIAKDKGSAVYMEGSETWITLPDEALVSMNYWGFTPKIFADAQRRFTIFLDNSLETNPMKCEHVIPTMIGECLKEGSLSVKVMSSNDKWFGITYQEDKPDVVEMFELLKQEGKYPFDLWK